MSRTRITISVPLPGPFRASTPVTGTLLASLAGGAALCGLMAIAVMLPSWVWTLSLVMWGSSEVAGGVATIILIAADRRVKRGTSRATASGSASRRR